MNHSIMQSLHLFKPSIKLGKNIMQFPVSSSSTPSGTDESLCEFLVMLEETSPHVGKFLKLLKKQLPNSFYVKLFFLAGAGVVL